MMNLRVRNSSNELESKPSTCGTLQKRDKVDTPNFSITELDECCGINDYFSLPTTDTLPSNKGVVYFNNAGKVPLPPLVEAVGRRALLGESRPWEEVKRRSLSQSSPSFLSLQSTVQEVRNLFACLINAPLGGHSIAICPSAGFAITMTARNAYCTGILEPNDVVLVLQDGMSSEVYGWQDVADILVVELNGGDEDEDENNSEHYNDWTKSILNAIRSSQRRVSVVCVPPLHWSDGSLIDLKAVGDACKKIDALFVVDATQAVGIAPISVQNIGCHVLVASVHKWLLGPRGTCLMYVDPKFVSDSRGDGDECDGDKKRGWLPLDQHERSRVAFQDERESAGKGRIGPSGYPEAFVSGTSRLDAGGGKNPILLPMVLEGLRIVLDGPDPKTSQAILRQITDRIVAGASKFGLGIRSGPRAGHIIGLRPEGATMRRIMTPDTMLHVAERLAGRNVFLAVRSGAFRISPYLNTTEDEVDQLLQALEEECQKILDDENGKDDEDWILVFKS